jgi:predicted ATPase
MLTQFRFENFKSWRDTGEIRMAPLTGFFGTNSSGKTAILQFLLMLKQTAESNDQKLVLNLGNDRTYVNLGTSYDISNQHIIPREIKFSIEWSPDPKFFNSLSLPAKSFSGMKVSWREEPEIEPYELPRSELYKSTLKLKSNILISTNNLQLSEFFYQFVDANNDFHKIGLQINENSLDNNQYNSFLEGALFDGLDVYFDFELAHRSTKNHKFYGNFGFSDIFVDDFPQNLILNLEEQFEKIFYLGPLREYPQRSYLWSGEQPQDVGKKGEFIASALLASRNNDMDVEKHVAHWLKELGLIHDFQIQPIAENRRDYEILVRRSPDSPQVLITDVGFGVSQILPVLVLCYYVPKGSTIIFEQPEIHLHPSVQAGLADVFIDVIKTRNVQIILESHSEHLLRRLQRRIAEEHKDMKPEDAALYFCSIDDTGTSKLTTLELDTYGNINNWPQGFFGDEMGDLVAMTEAAMRRQMTKN